jgi:hypothetical protein
MRFRSIAAVIAGSCLAVGVVAAQTQETKAPEKKAPEKKMEMPKPGPEVKKLGYFVGSWKTDADIKENAMGMPAGKMTETAKCEWFHGGFSVVCHSTSSGPMGNMHALGILGYSGEEKKYTYYGVDNSGHSEMAMGTNDGNNWTYTAEEKMGGKTIHGRYTITEVSPTSYTFKYETSEDGQTWNAVMEGKSSKTLSKAMPAEKK